MPDEIIGQGEVQAPVGGNEGGSQPGSGMNPAWNSMLQAVPEQYHNQLIPHLKSWDQGVQQQFQKIHNGYAGWKQFQDAGVDPATVDYALQLMEAINTEPRRVYDALAAYHANEWGNNQQQQQPEGLFEENNGPDQQSLENRQLQERVDLLSQILLEQYNSQQQQAEDEALDNELKRLEQQYGQFDERFVLGRVMAGQSPEEAVKEFQSFINEVRTQRPRAPQILSSGGQIPTLGNGKPKPGSETRDVVANLLRASTENR